MFIHIRKVIKNPLLINSTWAIIGSFISKGSNFVAIAWIARTLGPTLFGEYNVIQTTVGMFGTVSGLGLGLAATKLIAEFKDQDIFKTGRMISTLYLLSFLISLTVAIVFFTTAGFVSNSLLHNSKLTLLLQITSLIVIFDSINGVQNGVLVGFESFKEMTYISMIVGIVSAPLLVFGTVYFGITGLVIMLLLTRLINVVANRIYLNRKFKVYAIKLKYNLNKEILKNIFSIGIPSFLSSLSTSPVNWISTSIFVSQPLGYQSLGLYNTANQLRNIVLLLPDSAGKVTIPRLANAYGNREIRKFRKTVVFTFIWNFILSLFPALILFFCQDLFEKFLGSKFNFSSSLILIVLSTGILIALTNAIGYIFICSNLIWYDFILRVFWGISLLIFILLYGRYNGAIGYGNSVLGSSIVHMFAQIIVLIVKFRNKIIKNE